MDAAKSLPLRWRGDPPPDCHNLGKDIAGHVEAIEYRMGDISRSNREGIRTGRGNPSGSGHKERIDNLKDSLEKHIKTAQDYNCPYDPKADKYLPPKRR